MSSENVARYVYRLVSPHVTIAICMHKALDDCVAHRGQLISEEI